MSASCSALGCSFTYVSHMNRLRPGSISRFIAAKCSAPFARPSTCSMNFRWLWYVSIIPQIMPCASPRCTSIAPISVLNLRSAAFATSGVTPSRAPIS